MNRACRNCMWWVELGGDQDGVGDCRALPPQIVVYSDDGEDCRWPVTNDEEWCGAFRMTETLEPAG